MLTSYTTTHFSFHMQTSPVWNLLSIHNTHCLLAYLPLVSFVVFCIIDDDDGSPRLFHILKMFLFRFFFAIPSLWKMSKLFPTSCISINKGICWHFFFLFGIFCVFLVLFSFQREFLLHSEWKHVRYRSFFRRLSCFSWFKSLLED